MEKGFEFDITKTIGANFQASVDKRIGENWREEQRYKDFIDACAFYTTDGGEYRDKLLDVIVTDDQKGFGLLFKDGSMVTLASEEKEPELFSKACIRCSIENNISKIMGQLFGKDINDEKN